MRFRAALISILILLTYSPFAKLPAVQSRSVPSTDRAAPASVAPADVRSPVTFEQNVGQVDARVRFIVRGDDLTTYLTDAGAVFALALPQAGRAAAVMTLDGANPAPAVITADVLPSISNYFIGNDPAQWHTNVAHYGSVRFADVYPGVDLVYRATADRLRYDFVVHPGADASSIHLRFEGMRGLSVDGAGDLLLTVGEADAGTVLRHSAPYSYQPLGDATREVRSRFQLDGDAVTFVVGEYDPALPLVIDPTLVYSTFLGGAIEDEGRAIRVNSAGNAYVAGSSSSNNFPVTPGSYDTSPNTFWDVFVTKLNPSGSGLIYSTFVGGSFADYGYGFAIDANGNAYVAGYTDSANFPTTFGAYDTSLNGPASGPSDAFVFKLNPAGSVLAYSTYVGGSSFERGLGLALDEGGIVVVVGDTASANFPTTTNAFDTSYSGGNVDAFMTALNATGTALVHSTVLGGQGTVEILAIAVDADGNSYVTVNSNDGAFPTTPNAFDTTHDDYQDAFVTKFNPTGTALVFSTLLGEVVLITATTSRLLPMAQWLLWGRQLVRTSRPLQTL